MNNPYTFYEQTDAEMERLQEQNSKLTSALETVATLLGVNPSPENVARAIVFIRATLEQQPQEAR